VGAALRRHHVVPHPHTLESGRVSSKKAALRWGQHTLDARWSALLRQALEDRALGFDAAEAPRPGSIEQTRAFAEYAKQRARSRP
jgi:hypothetical protein